MGVGVLLDLRKRIGERGKKVRKENLKEMRKKSAHTPDAIELGEDEKIHDGQKKKKSSNNFLTI